MKGVATRYPRVDPGAARLVNLEGRINLCRERHQGAAPLHTNPTSCSGSPPSSRTSRAACRSRVALDAQNRANFERGRDFYHLRQGQMNLVVRALPRPQLGREACRRDREPGARQRLSRLPARMAGRGLAAPALPQLSLRRARGDARPPARRSSLDLELYLAWRASGPADRNAGRAALRRQAHRTAVSPQDGLEATQVRGQRSGTRRGRAAVQVVSGRRRRYHFPEHKDG